MGSTRLPGKALASIGARPMLDWVARRVSRASLVDSIVVATTTDARDDSIVRFCDESGYTSFRGSEQDVLDRYWNAALASKADVIVRITSDCPLIDSEVIDLVIDRFLASGEEIDYAANTLEPRTYPRGLDVEVFSRAALERAWLEDTRPESREHVTPYIYLTPGRFRTLRVGGANDYSGHRWTVDTPEDLAFARAVYAEFPDGEFGYRDVLELLSLRPEVALLNAGVKQKAMPSQR
jgi:spore coat polysaccharide biosynthesis protein SpsF